MSKEADVYLILAELLEGLKHVGRAGHRFGSVASESCADCAKALKAIAKAEGGK